MHASIIIRPDVSTREFAHSLVINAPSAAVLDAFFDADSLAAWWLVIRSLCVPRPLGCYAVEWETTEWRDDKLGRLGGVLHATVVDFKPGREFFLADAYWLPPDGPPIGPMALEAVCTTQGTRTLLHVRQSGCDSSSERWARYYDIIATGWMLALEKLKTLLEERWAP
jgi:uncharacterized protein YndB with AHSA1/START domain